jgi:hypothetical protein
MMMSKFTEINGGWYIHIDCRKPPWQISSQKAILQKFAEDHHFPSPCFYVDDGFSGGNFQRPAFQQMISDMENGEIGIIVTKDLSHLGRNQLHTGLYIEERFPMFGVRYIAINDNVDTDSSESNDLMPFKNLFKVSFALDRFSYPVTCTVTEVAAVVMDCSWMVMLSPAASGCASMPLARVDGTMEMIIAADRRHDRNLFLSFFM